jgi:hypothetical protein
MTNSQLRTVEGACHCGAVRFSVGIDLEGAFRCNCSICSKTAATVAASEPSDFELRSGEAELAEYRFGSRALTRFFCKRCGIHCFARGRGPDGKEFVGINLNTLEDTELGDLRVIYFDGRHDVFEPRSTPAPIFPERRMKA